MSSQTAQVSVGSAGAGLYVGLNGRATQRVCSTVDRLISDYLAAHADSPHVTMDLSDCPWVDSTFAGWILGLRKRLARVRGGSLALAGCSERCRASFEKMRIAALFEFSPAPPPADVRDVPCSAGDRPDLDTLTIMAHAHEELAAIDGENERVFAPVARLLRHQLEGGS